MTRVAKYLLDTDILIEYIRGRTKAVDYLNQLTGELMVSVITVAELYVGTRSDLERRTLGQFLSLFASVAVDHRIAVRGAGYRREYMGSHGTGLNDALIAATAEVTGASLVTFNQRHFPMVSNLIVPYRR